jgi:hypothetical protein
MQKQSHSWLLSSAGLVRKFVCYEFGVEGITGRKGNDLRGDGLLPAPLSPPLQRSQSAAFLRAVRPRTRL